MMMMRHLLRNRWADRCCHRRDGLVASCRILDRFEQTGIIVRGKKTTSVVTVDSTERAEAMRREYLENVTTKYPTFRPSLRIGDFQSRFADLESGSREVNVKVSLAGRITGKREAGKSLCFYDVTCENQKIQVLAEKKYFEGGPGDFRATNQNLRRGDIVGFEGFPGKSNRGELSLIPERLTLLSPCLHPLPTDRQPFEDVHLRFAQRYVDLLSNPTPLLALKQRAKALKFLRTYLDDRGFLEVETPILSVSSGGANATPFRTHSTGLGSELQLRVAPELFLKQLLVGGVERVYEIGKVFRNEGLSPVHAPEFTSCELYMAFANYEDLMRLTENMLPALVEAVTGSTTLRVPRSLASHCVGLPDAECDDDLVDVDFSGPFKRLDVMAELRDHFGLIPSPSDDDAFRSRLLEICKAEDALPDEPRTTARLLDALIGHCLEPE